MRCVCERCVGVTPSTLLWTALYAFRYVWAYGLGLVVHTERKSKYKTPKFFFVLGRFLFDTNGNYSAFFAFFCYIQGVVGMSGHTRVRGDGRRAAQLASVTRLFQTHMSVVAGGGSKQVLPSQRGPAIDRVAYDATLY